MPELGPKKWQQTRQFLVPRGGYMGRGEMRACAAHGQWASLLETSLLMATAMVTA